MYKSMSVEEIAKRPDLQRLGNLETLTMFYDPVQDEIILNSNYKYYDICEKLVTGYLLADDEHREKYKNQLNHFEEEVSLLDHIIKIRERQSYPDQLRNQYAKEFKMIGSSNAFWEEYDFLKIIDLIVRPDFKLIDAYNWGYIQGKRAERARRKKVAQ